MITRLAMILLWLILAYTAVDHALAQGCSDAGLCTISGMKAPPAFEEIGQQTANILIAGLAMGQGSRDISVFSPYLAYERVLGSTISTSAKLTYASISGELGKHAGLGDLFLNVNWAAIRRNKGNLILTAGTKIPLSKADANGEGFSLPMDYQSSLETFDLIVGVGYSHGPFDIHFGWQQPLSSEVSNDFLASEYPDARALNYSSTNRFTRKADALMRVAYDILIRDGRFRFRPSLLPIFHVANDTYIDSLGKTREIEDSRGLTLNGNLFLAYQITSAHALELSFGIPFITRDARPDGLTREFVLGLEYRLAF